MTASGTYNFNPPMGETVIYAFNLCGVRATALTQEHFESARMAMNMLLTTWSSRGTNLWRVSLQTIPLVQGVATYTVPADNIVMLDTYIETVNSAGVATDQLILPISRTEYASYPSKQQQGRPTVFWQDRQITSSVTLWPVPDGTQTSLKFYQVGQIDDAGYTNGQTVNVPAYFQEALSLGLAARLAMIWAPDRAIALKASADESYQIAAEQNIETSAFFVSPQLSGYYQ